MRYGCGKEFHAQGEEGPNPGAFLVCLRSRPGRLLARSLLEDSSTSWQANSSRCRSEAQAQVALIGDREGGRGEDWQVLAAQAALPTSPMPKSLPKSHLVAQSRKMRPNLENGAGKRGEKAGLENGEE